MSNTPVLGATAAMRDAKAKRNAEPEQGQHMPRPGPISRTEQLEALVRAIVFANLWELERAMTPVELAAAREIRMQRTAEIEKSK